MTMGAPGPGPGPGPALEPSMKGERGATRKELAFCWGARSSLRAVVTTAAWGCKEGRRAVSSVLLCDDCEGT